MALKHIINLNSIQATASRPDQHVWVNANAGTGKTTILTSRVLRLLLQGTPPHKFLCLTYTKAGAAEMQNRIARELSHWAVCPEPELMQRLQALTGIDQPSHEMLIRARSLFIHTLETEEGLKIQTIHAFCQSLLRRFPIEAGVSPYFKLMDEAEAFQVAEQALAEMFSILRQGKWPDIESAIDALLEYQSDFTLKKMLDQSIRDMMQWERWKQHFMSHEHAIIALANILHIRDNEVELLQAEITTPDADIAKLHQLLQDFAELKKPTGETLQLLEILPKKLNQQLNNHEELDKYIAAFITQKGRARQFRTKFTEEIKSLLEAEAKRVEAYIQRLATLDAYKKTTLFYQIVDHYLDIYQRMCSKLGLMDYQQLLMKAKQLLSGQHRISGWVMYKLDGGVDHILVDEAQDTSPEQWRIIESLADEFFTGEGRAEHIRTLFVVGDEKQSIFSFQGADQQEFQRMRDWFADKASQSASPFAIISLQDSYRSAERILEAVNVTTKEQGFEAHHASTRSEGAYAGRVVMWPHIEKPKKAETSKPQEAEEAEQEEGALQQQLAEKISAEVERWINSGKCAAGDVMILVRTRSTLVEALVRALGNQGIATTSSDNQILSEHLAVRDLLALARFLLLPESDYDLACILRSPIGQIEEETLFELAYNRDKQTLWQRLQAAGKNNAELAALVEHMKRWQNQVDYISPYQLFHRVIFTPPILQRYKARFGNDVEAIFQFFLVQVQKLAATNPASMQCIVTALEESKVVIKINESSADALRIMTVHGAKGLEANIVILADTATKPKENHGISWIETEAGELPMFLPSKDICEPMLAVWKEVLSRKEMQEYQRLLYVAMTRAREELYITGYATQKLNGSWYELLQTSLQPIANQLQFGEDTDATKIANPVAAKIFSTIDSAPVLTQPLKASLKQKAIQPSRIFSADEADPMPSIFNEARQYGRALHAALQLLKPPLVNLIDQQAVDTITAIVSKRYQLKDAEHLKCSVWELVQHTDTEFLFTHPLLLNETAISGRIQLDGQSTLVSAQVDRAIRTEEGIWLVDFKTSERIPESLHTTPKHYIRQLAIYREIIHSLFPDEKIFSALVWTEAPKLQQISEEILIQTLLDEWAA